MAVWDRMPKETTKAFAAFCTYRDMGPERSMNKAYRVSKGCQKGAKRVTGTWQKWARQWQWVERVRSYDEHLDRLVQEESEKRAKEQGERISKLRMKRYALADVLLQKAEKMAAYPLAERESADGKTIVKPAKWSFATIGNLQQTVDRLIPELAQQPKEEATNDLPEIQIDILNLNDFELENEIRRLEQRRKRTLFIPPP